MKKLLFLLLAAPIFTFGQVIGNGDGITTDVQVGIVFFELDIEGSPYMNPTYKLGETFINGKSGSKALMRYNAYNASIELLDENNTPRKLLRRRSIEAIFDGKTYKIFEYAEAGKIRESYFNPLNKGKIKLLLKPKKSFVQAEQPEDGYDKFDPPIYKNISSYYVIDGDSPATKTRLGKKQILKHLPRHNAQIKKFIASEKLNLKTESDIIKLFDYYNSLLPPSIEKGAQS